METLLIVLLLQGVIFGGFCSFIAGQKNREAAGWFVLGFLFSLVALLALVAVPTVDKASQQEHTPIMYVPRSPPVPEKTKTIRMLIIVIGITLLILAAYLLRS
jgi:hypothetical protein